MVQAVSAPAPAPPIAAPINVPPAKVIGTLVQAIKAGKRVYLTESAAKHFESLLRKLGASLKKTTLTKSADDSYILISIERFDVYVEVYENGVRKAYWRVHINKLKSALKEYLAELDGGEDKARDEEIEVYEVVIDTSEEKIVETDSNGSGVT